MESIFHVAIGLLPKWLVPLLFAPALVTGREEAATVAHSASWTPLVAVVGALVVYAIYVPMLVRITHRVAFMQRTVDKFTGLRPVAWLFGHIDAGPIWWRCAKVAAIGFLPTVGFGAGILWARSGSKQGQLVRMSAVVVGATASYWGYHTAIGWVMTLPAALGAAIVGAIVALAIGYRQREHLRPAYRYCRMAFARAI